MKTPRDFCAATWLSCRNVSGCFCTDASSQGADWLNRRYACGQVREAENRFEPVNLGLARHSERVTICMAHIGVLVHIVIWQMAFQLNRLALCIYLFIFAHGVLGLCEEAPWRNCSSSEILRCVSSGQSRGKEIPVAWTVQGTRIFVIPNRCCYL